MRQRGRGISLAIQRDIVWKKLILSCFFVGAIGFSFTQEEEPLELETAKIVSQTCEPIRLEVNEEKFVGVWSVLFEADENVVLEEVDTEELSPNFSPIVLYPDRKDAIESIATRHRPVENSSLSRITYFIQRTNSDQEEVRKPLKQRVIYFCSSPISEPVQIGKFDPDDQTVVIINKVRTALAEYLAENSE